jgi:hypothetical protein
VDGTFTRRVSLTAKYQEPTTKVQEYSLDKEQIYQDLNRLLTEIDLLPMEEQERLRLHSLVSEIEMHVDEPKEKAHREELVNTVDEVITRFETEHPSFTGVLRRVLNALGSMGV